MDDVLLDERRRGDELDGPEPLRLPVLRLIPFLVLATMAYWLWRYRRSRRSMTARDGINLTAPEAAR